MTSATQTKPNHVESYVTVVFHWAFPNDACVKNPGARSSQPPEPPVERVARGWQGRTLLRPLLYLVANGAQYT